MYNWNYTNFVWPDPMNPSSIGINGHIGWLDVYTLYMNMLPDNSINQVIAATSDSIVTNLDNKEEKTAA